MLLNIGTYLGMSFMAVFCMSIFIYDYILLRNKFKRFKLRKG